MSAEITITGLTKNYGRMKALDDITITFRDGEFLVLLGPSGCGKTTLLRCIAGLETPDAGEIRIGGEIVFSADQHIFTPPGKRNLGMVFQSYALWPHMTVYDNIGFGLNLQSIPRQEIPARITSVLKDLAMTGLENRYPSELSGGQQQRVAVARLLAARPQLFLMDEPLSNLDARLRVDMRAELKRLHHDIKVTTVYVTHDQTEALTMADRVVIMRDGRIMQAGSPHEIYARPANLFTAEFIAMPQINILPVVLEQLDDGISCIIADYQVRMQRQLPECKVLAAVRPENIRIHPAAVPGAVEFKIYSVLPAGPETFYDLKRDTTRLMVRDVNARNLEMDQTVWIEFDIGTINYYDEENGEPVLLE
ncbi:MAG: ABC transporter ATP-binding protein [Desulfobacteraceae bacterium]|nr:ABC transporter ATP-binding protein [Desulfobacteraceae bacterium]